MAILGWRETMLEFPKIPGMDFRRRIDDDKRLNSGRNLLSMGRKA